MFIVFEGIDGSGKTTISNRVVERLRATGLSVTHVREEGTFTSTAAQAIRDLGRDARHLMLTPLAELLLYVARDGQSLEEAILPALAATDVVIADRYLYSAELLATAERGLAADLVARIVAPVGERARPDLAILVDVPPDIARARRRIAKLRTPDRRPPSRKGLAGGGLQVRLRRAHRELAERDPATWLIVDNGDAELDALVTAVAAAITTAVRAGVGAGLAEGRRRLPPPGPPGPPGLATAADAHRALLAWVDRRASREPDLAAYVLGGHPGDDVEARRWALAARAPLVVAHGLAGLDDAGSWRLRDALRDAAPDGVARSLDGLTSAVAYRYRRALLARAPEAVAASLGGLDDDAAWALRAQLHDAVPDTVVASLAGVRSARATQARRAWLTAQSPAGPTTYVAARAGARLVSGLADELGWRVRDLVADLAPVEALASTKGDDGARAWQWRARYADRAPRAVADSLHGMTQPAAWALRAALAGSCREIFQSMVGLDDAEAWALRERHATTWPSTVCKSLGALAGTPRGAALIATLLATRPDGIALLRNAARRPPPPTGAARAAVAPATADRAAPRPDECIEVRP